jgi:hypothetical protein
VPVSTFRGAPKAERTAYVYDDQGRVQTSTTYHEAEWTDVDRALALALAGVEARMCPCGCGHPAEIAWDDDNDGWFEVDTSVVCHARNALDRWREDESRDVEPGVLPQVRFTRDRDTDKGA